MKIFMSILVIISFSLLHTMEKKHSVRNHNIDYRKTNFKNVSDMKYPPIILRVISTNNCRNRYNECSISDSRDHVPNSLRNFKVKSKEDLTTGNN